MRMRAILVLALCLCVTPTWALEEFKPLATLQDAAVATGNGTVLDVALYNSVALEVTIATTATVTFEGTVDGSTWASTVCTSIANTSATLVTSATATGTYQCNVAGLSKFRARISSWGSGAVTVKARATTAVISRRGGAGGGLASTDIDTCAEIAAIVSGETGTCGSLVLSQGPTLADAVVTGSLNVPNGAAPTTDAFGEVAGDNNAWAASRGAMQFFDGTANTYILGALASDTPSNGQVPTWNTGGTITWESVAGTGDVTAAAAFSTDNVLIKSDGTGKGVQATGISVADTTNIISGSDAITFGSNPGDAGRLRLSNGTGEGLCWEIATPGTDKCLIVNSSDQLDFNGTLNLSGAATGSVVINGVTSGSFTITGADAMAQSVTATVAAQTSGATVLTIPDMAGVNDTFAFLTKAGTLANKTVDCTAAGNVCTIYKYMQLDLVGVAGGTAGHIWDDDPLSTTCTAASTAGTNQTRTFCTFPDSDGEYGKQLKLSLPTGYVAGTLQFRVSWKTTGTGNFRPRLQTLCYASDAASDTAYSNSTYITAAAGTSARFNQTAWTTATDTGCDAEETMAIRFSRNRTEGSDTLNSTADVEFVGVRYAVAQ